MDNMVQALNVIASNNLEAREFGKKKDGKGKIKEAAVRRDEAYKRKRYTKILNWN